jgi:hypothetical protein
MFGVNISILRRLQSFRFFFFFGDEPIKEAHCQKKKKKKKITIGRHCPIIKYVQKKKGKSKAS